jgi:hypothetical protein
LAFALMDSHLHFVLRQCEDPLFRLMQPVLRRVALLVQKRWRVEGHVTEREFQSAPCLTPSYLRNAIIYTHLNPFRAGMVSEPCDGPTSHAAYMGASSNHDLSFVRPALELFALDWSGGVPQWRINYADHVAFRVSCDRCESAGLPRPPFDLDPVKGNAYFNENFATSALRPHTVRTLRRDLRDLAINILAVQAPDTHLSSLRGPYLPSRHFQKIRHEIIRAAAREGHSGRDIARFFQMSPTRVSEIARGRFSTEKPVQHS